MKRVATALLLIACGCTNGPVPPDTPPEKIAADQNVIDQHTKFFRKYDGLYETFRAHATLLTATTQNAILDKRGEFLNWDHKKLTDEKEKVRQEMGTQTTIFLQFYAPDTEYNDLNRYNTIWRAYLEIDGRRFEGKVRKAHGKPIEFQAIYPNYDRFSTAYDVIFNVSTANTALHGAKLVLASTLGQGEFVYLPEQ